MFVDISDFIGEKQLSQNQYESVKLTSYINTYESEYLIDLFRV